MPGLADAFATISIHPDASAVSPPNQLLNRFTSWRKAARSRLRRGHGRDMAAASATREVIEISDDDEELLVTSTTRSAATFEDPFTTHDRSRRDHHYEAYGQVIQPHLAPARRSSGTRKRTHQDDEVRKPKSGLSIKRTCSASIQELANRQHRFPQASSIPKRHLDGDRAAFSSREYETGNAYPKTINLAQPRDVVHEPYRDPTKPRVTEDPCPYYYDPKLEVKMFRGSGYARFPIVLGTVEGHRAICEEWESREAQRRYMRSRHPTPSFKAHRSSLDETLLLSASPDPSASSHQPHVSSSSHIDAHQEQDCLEEVIQIFPQIQLEYVRGLYREACAVLQSSSQEREAANSQPSGIIVAQIAELKTYPREKQMRPEPPPTTPDSTGVTIQWDKRAMNEFRGYGAASYQKLAVILLAKEFTHVPTHHIYHLLGRRQTLFDTFNELSRTERNYFMGADRPYKRTRHPRTVLEKKYQRGELETRDGHLYVNLVNELQAARQNQAREIDRIQKQKEHDEKEADNLAMSIAQGSMVECRCCFDDVAMNRAVTCEGDVVHFFCNSCVERQAQSQVGAMRYEMSCMDTSGCNAELSTEGISKAIPIQLYDRLSFNQQQADIVAAAIDDLEECPFCDFKAICDPVEINSTFDCQNPGCARLSCRNCKEESHLPRSCGEVKAGKGLDARHAVEEARSEATIRTCPKCKVKIIKDYGCNKMFCTNCRTILCYVCKKDISGRGRDMGYDHFHQPGAKCSLHDLPQEDRHAQEANAAEEAAIAKAKAEDIALDEKDLRVEAHLPKDNHDSMPPAMRPHLPQFAAMPGLMQRMPVPYFPALRLPAFLGVNHDVANVPAGDLFRQVPYLQQQQVQQLELQEHFNLMQQVQEPQPAYVRALHQHMQPAAQPRLATQEAIGALHHGTAIPFGLGLDAGVRLPQAFQTYRPFEQGH